MTNKILFVNPISRFLRGFAIQWDSKYPPVSIGILAALTPDDWEVEVYDENFDEFELRKDVDLVAITALTATAFRGYEIAKAYRDIGIPVIMGGVHVSMLPDEAEQFVDSVIVGEGEGVWKGVLEDFKNNRLKKRYVGSHTPPEDIPVARHDIFHKDYLFHTIQTTRGCPSSCDFCSVHKLNGNVHRQRPVKDIIAELESVPEGKLIFFVDDNIIGYSKKSRDHAVELFKEMVKRKLNRRWISQTSLNVAEDPEVLKWAQKSGCRTMLIGIESESEEMLSNLKKKVNLKVGVKQYSKQFKKIQRKGIPVLGTFIFGHDTDTPESLKKRADFILKCGVDLVQASILTPFPGTTVFHNMKRENRIEVDNFPYDWQRFHFYEPVIKLQHVDIDTLYRIMMTNWAKIYNKWELRKRFLRTWWRTRSFQTAFWAYQGNWQYRRLTMEQCGINADVRKNRNYEFNLAREKNPLETELRQIRKVS